jgi:hypothetical protein
MKRGFLLKNLPAFAGIVIIFFLSSYKAGEPEVQISKKPIYLNIAYSFDERAADLVSRLTPEEKESLLGNSMTAVPRLGINSFNVWSEALHGVMRFNMSAAASHFISK